MVKTNKIMSDIKSRIKKFVLIFCVLLLSFSSIYCFFENKNYRVGYCSSSAEIVLEVDSKRVLFESNSDKKMYMASTTKILTAIVIIENCNIDEIVTVTEKSVGVEGSSIYLEVGEKLSVKHLLYGLMLRSGNDCAETLALHCSGSIDAFSRLMNETAQKIGAKDSNFVNPHGLHDDNHYTTAYDLAIISAYAMQNQEFRQIVSTKSIKIPHTMRDYDRILVNKNKMLNEFDGATGIKTGFTKKAGRCLVSSAERNGLELICVVLNCPQMFEQSKNLLDSCFSKYNNYKLIESDNIIDFIEIDNQNIGTYVKKDIVLPLTEEEFESVKIILEYDENISKPIKKDTEIGIVKIYVENNLIFQEKIYTIVKVD